MNLVGLMRRVPVGVWALLALGLPFAVLLVAVSTREWYPSSDQALEVLQIDEVGTEHSPRLGVYSRWGWNHPGPLLFYLAAPLQTLVGSGGVLLSIGLLNGAATAVAALAAWRRGGPPLLAIVVGVLLLVLRTVGADRLVDPWNPSVVLVPLFALGLVCWSVAERDVWSLPVAVLLGSFVVQAHVGVALLVAALGVAALALSWRGTSRRGLGEPALLGPGWARSLSVSIGAAILVWLPPLFEELRNDPGNLTLLVRFARDPSEDPSGLTTGLQMAAAHLGLPPGWVTALDLHGFDLDVGAWTWISMVATVGTLAALGWLSFRRGGGGAGRLATLAVVLLVAGVLSTARISGVLFHYLTWPWWSIGALAWTSILWSGWTLIAERVRPSARHVAVCTGVALTGLAISSTWNTTRVEVPRPRVSAALAHLLPETTRKLDEALAEGEPVVLRWADNRNWASAGKGLFLGLEQGGFDVFVPPVHEDSFDEWHRREREEFVSTVWLTETDDFLLGMPLPTDAVAIASHDPLTPAERARHDALWEQISGDADTQVAPFDADSPAGREQLVVAGADPDEVEEFGRLREGSSAYTVYLLDGPPFRDGRQLEEP